jgi:hypothetical protein
MIMRIRTRRTRRMHRGLAITRCELIFREALAAKQYSVALEALALQCRLHGFKIDGPIQPGNAPTISPETWEKLVIDSKKRRDS